MRECEEMFKIVQRSRDSRLDLVACKPPEVTHVLSMPKAEESR